MKITPIAIRFNNHDNFQSKKSKQHKVTENPIKNTIIQFAPNNYVYGVKSGYEDYETAQKIFRKNLKDGKGVFGDPKNVSTLIQNDKIRRNLVKFFAEYSREESDKLDAKKNLTIDEIRYRNDLREVRDFFSEYDNYWTDNKRCFESKKACIY